MPLVNDPPSTPMCTPFFPRSTSLKSGCPDGKPSPTSTVCLRPFILRSAAFGGAMTNGIVGPEAEAAAALEAAAAADAAAAAEVEVVAGAAGGFFGVVGVTAPCAVGAAGLLEDGLPVPVWTCAWNGSFAAKSEKFWSCVPAGGAVVDAPTEVPAVVPATAIGSGGVDAGGLSCFSSFGPWITPTTRRTAPSPIASRFERRSRACAAVRRRPAIYAAFVVVVPDGPVAPTAGTTGIPAP